MLSNFKNGSSRICLRRTPGIDLPVDDPHDYTNGRQDRSDEGKRLRPEKMSQPITFCASSPGE